MATTTNLSLSEVLKAIEQRNLYLSTGLVDVLCAEIVSFEKQQIYAKKTGGPKKTSQNSIDPNKFIEDFCKKYELVLDTDDIVPKPKTLWPSFRGKKCFSTVKLNYRGYGSVLWNESKKNASSIVFDGQRYVFNEVIPGMFFSQYGFQRQMEKILNDMLPAKVAVYLDAIYVFGKTEDELYSNANQVMKRIFENCRMPDEAECTLFQKSVELLGYRVSNGKLKIPPQVLEVIGIAECPKTLIELFRFMAVAGFYKEMIKGFARLAAPLTDLLDGPRSVVEDMDWQQKHQISFEVLQKKLLMKPVLAICDEAAQKLLYVTSSKIVIEGDLLQIDSTTQEKVAIGYFSARVESDMQNWDAFDLEMLAITESCLFFQPYLKKSFTVYTCNPPQMYRDRFKSPKGQLKKLKSKIGDFSFQVRHAVKTDADDDFYEFIKKT